MNETPLRILTLANVPPDPNSGAAGTVYHTNVALRELGHHVDEIWENQLGPRRIKHGNLHSLIEQPRRYRREVLKAVKGNEYDVVLMSQPQSYLAAQALKKAKFPGVVLNRSHGVELRVEEVLPKWHKALSIQESRYPYLTKLLQIPLQNQWHKLIGSCDGFVVGAEKDRMYLHERLHIPLECIAAIPHGVNDAFLATPIQSNRRILSKRILHVGQFAFIKGSYQLASIVDRILTEDQEARFTWVCAESHHEKIRQMLSADTQERVHLLDWRPIKELSEIYDQHGIFIFPSLFEGFGKAAFEAMARGNCVVSSDEGGMHDLINNGKNGYLIEVGNEAAFVEQILYLMQSPELLDATSREARATAEACSWAACAKSIIAFTQHLQKHKGSSRQSSTKVS